MLNQLEKTEFEHLRSVTGDSFENLHFFLTYVSRAYMPSEQTKKQTKEEYDRNEAIKKVRIL